MDVRENDAPGTAAFSHRTANRPSCARMESETKGRPAPSARTRSHASTAFDNRFDSSTDSSVSRRGSSAGTRASQRTSIPAAWAGAKYAAMTAFATKLSA